jgi:hypothetical protein
VFLIDMMLVLVVLPRLGFGSRRALRGAQGVRVVRWSRALLAPPKLASADGLDVRKSKVLVVVQVIQNLVVCSTKGVVVGGFEALSSRMTD